MGMVDEAEKVASELGAEPPKGDAPRRPTDTIWKRLLGTTTPEMIL